MTSTSRKYDLVVFDWDGTVMDTTGLIAEGIRQAAAALGCRVPDRKTASSVIGLDWRSAMAIAVPDCPAERLDEFNEAYKAWYLPRERDVCLFEGIEDLMRRLHADGVTLAVATGKSRAGLRRVFNRTNVEELFSITRTAEETAPKPNPDMLEEIGLYTDIPKERTLMVGDTVHDIVMAQRYGCDVAAMTYGAQPRRDLVLSNPTVLCDTVAELARFIEG